MGAPLNNHEIVVKFVGSNNVVATPDPNQPIVWTIWDQDGGLLLTESQTADQWEALEDGSYRFDYAPPLGVEGIQSVAETIIDGKPAAAWAAQRIRVPGYMRAPESREA